MTLVFDTSALSSWFDDNDRIVRIISRQNYDRALIPLSTDAEMRYGFAHGSKTVENLKNYGLFIQQFNLEVIAPNQDTSIIYGDLAAWSRQHGFVLSNNDLWIAATTIQQGGTLATLDKDFANLPQVFQLNLKIT
jgi:predicted nucleic acid-binding protein